MFNLRGSLPERPARALAALLIACSTLVVSAQPVGGQSMDAPTTGGTDLSVSPAVVDDALDPGTNYDINIRLTNMTEGPVAVRGGSRELIPDQEVPDAKAQAFDASSWFTVQNPEFILLGKEQRNIKVSVAVPPNAEPGGHYATINFDSLAPQQRPDGATSVSTRVGVLVLLTVSGDIRWNATLTGPVAVDDWQLEAGPTPFSVNMRNDGNVHVVPQGSFVVTDLLGREVERLPITPGVVLPGAERRFDVNWEHGLLTGGYRVKVDLTVGQDRRQVVSPESRFYLVPLVVVIPATAVFLLVVLIASMIIRRRRALTKGRRFADNKKNGGD